MTLIRILLLVVALGGVFIDPLGGSADGGPGMDPNGGSHVAARCGGDYTACIDPNG